jgi:hypothetical protein
MAKTAAQRQREYRRRRALAGANGERRIAQWAPTGTALALRRLARHQGVTQREVLVQLIARAEGEAIAGMDDAALDEYLSASAA